MTKPQGLIAGLLLSLAAHLLLLANWSPSTTGDIGRNVASVLVVELMAKDPPQHSASVESSTIESSSRFEDAKQTGAAVVSSPVPEADSERHEQSVSAIEPVVPEVEVSEPLAVPGSEASPTESVAESSEQHRNQLLQLIYLEISKHKHYPFMAKRRGTQGLVKVNFVMHPDGQVSDIAIVQSSRYTLLDEAATRAVQSISPFRLAASYLDQVRRYDVDIEFRLN